MGFTDRLDMVAEEGDNDQNDTKISAVRPINLNLNALGFHEEETVWKLWGTLVQSSEEAWAGYLRSEAAAT